LNEVQSSAIGRAGAALLREHAHDVALLHDQHLLAVDLDLGAGPLAEQNLVFWLQLQGNDPAVLAACTGADGDDLALLGFLRGGVGYAPMPLGPLRAGCTWLSFLRGSAAGTLDTRVPVLHALDPAQCQYKCTILPA
jgi:hypothetical protein